MKNIGDKECREAELDMYCDELHKNKKLSVGTLNNIKKIFEVYSELKDKFPTLVKELKNGI
ncbi:hypothetical protein K8R47_01350 [archaeon]|nr:hypothetical protein [archaeon]